MRITLKNHKPGKLKAKLAMAAFVVVAVGSLALTSVGLLHVVAQTSAPTALIANADVTAGTELLR